MRIVRIPLLIFLSLIFVSPAFSTNWCADANILGCYLMEIDEDPITDSSSGNFDADLKGAGEPNYLTASPPDTYSVGYYDFDGSDDYIVETTQANWQMSNTTSFTIVVWANADTFGVNREIVRYDDNDNLDSDTPTSRALWLFKHHKDNTTRFTFGDADATLHASSSSTTITSSGWHHLSAVRDVGSDNVKVYIDGVVRADDTDISTGTWTTDLTDLLIGRHDNVATQSFFDGDLDEIALFDTDLTSTDINDIMDNGLLQASVARRRMWIM